MAERKRRLQGKPSWVIASLAGTIAWAIVSVIAVVFFEATIASAVIVGLMACAIVAAPVVLIESVMVGVALTLELAFGAVAIVIVPPLTLLSGC